MLDSEMKGTDKTWKEIEMKV